MKVRYMRKDFWWTGSMEKRCHRRLKPLPYTRWKQINGKSVLVDLKTGKQV